MLQLGGGDEDWARSHRGTSEFIFGSFQLFYKNKIKLEKLIKTQG